MKSNYFPFTAIEGQERLKEAMVLAVTDPSIGGVLAMGEKGTGKTTVARSLSQLMDRELENFPFVDLPIGASEDRVLGSVDLEKLINEKEQVLQKGLLAQAHGGILYIDEVNLLSDHLMDLLLDAAATGGYRLEREGLSRWMESRFCLLGSMNPEEGELRPQLLDRFGLCAQVEAPKEKDTRKAIAEKRIAFDNDPDSFWTSYRDKEEALSKRILAAREALPKMEIPREVKDRVADLCIEHGVEGLRADILLIRAARASAALGDQGAVSKEDVEHVAPLVLEHRSRKGAGSSTQEGSSPDNGDPSKEESDPEKKSPLSKRL